MGGTEQVGGPLTDREALEKSSSDGLVKEALIWQHSALIPPSPSPGSPMSMSDERKTTEPQKKGVERREREKRLQQSQLAWKWNDLDLISVDPKSRKSR